ncbi:MAG: hypothetical protein ABJE95_31550, partial [Byssovorax sp.]
MPHRSVLAGELLDGLIVRFACIHWVTLPPSTHRTETASVQCVMRPFQNIELRGRNVAVWGGWIVTRRRLSKVPLILPRFGGQSHYAAIAAV